MDIKKDLNTMMFVLCVLSILIGIICVAFSSQLATAVPYILGSLIIIDGVYTLIAYFVRKDIALPNNFALAHGLIDLVLGILIIVLNDSFGIVVAIFLLIYGLFQLNICVNLRKLTQSFVLELIQSIMFIIFAILLLVFSKSAIKILIIVLGSGMIILGLYVGIKAIIINRKIKNVKDTIKEKVDDTFVETTAVKTEEQNNEEKQSED